MIGGASAGSVERVPAVPIPAVWVFAVSTSNVLLGKGFTSGGTTTCEVGGDSATSLENGNEEGEGTVDMIAWKYRGGAGEPSSQGEARNACMRLRQRVFSSQNRPKRTKRTSNWLASFEGWVLTGHWEASLC